MEINQNQIYIRSSVVISRGEANIYLHSPQDLGRGGMMLAWKDFSKDVPIATITQSNGRSLYLRWYGFFNKAKREYEWKTEAEFYSTGEDIKFDNCKDKSTDITKACTQLDCLALRHSSTHRSSSSSLYLRAHQHKREI